MATSGLVKLQPIEGGLTLLGNPKQMLKQAQEVAEVLMEVVAKQELSMKIGKSEHIYVTAWQFLAHFYGISAKIVEVRPIVDELSGAAGFEATADALMIATGQVISSGRAMCLNNEDNWNMRPKYEYQNNQRIQVGEVRVPSFQLESMAQTRAIAKVLSNLLRFVVALAGYDTTPAEEMTGGEHDQRDPSEKKQGRDPERKSNGAPKLITEPQRRRLFAIIKEVGCPMNTACGIWVKAGFDIAAVITQDKYDAIVKSVQEWKQNEQPATPTQG
jgi:hypothetical protein